VPDNAPVATIVAVAVLVPLEDAATPFIETAPEAVDVLFDIPTKLAEPTKELVAVDVATDAPVDITYPINKLLADDMLDDVPDVAATDA
jgi:hypothetical protein